MGQMPGLAVQELISNSTLRNFSNNLGIGIEQNNTEKVLLSLRKLRRREVRELLDQKGARKTRT